MSEQRIIFQGNRLWLAPEASLPEVEAELRLRLPEGHLALRVAEDHPVPEGVEAVGLRDAFPRMDPEAWARAGRASQWLEWAAGHRFCGSCATALEPCEGPEAGHGRRCPACGRTVFPSNATAIIVLIQRGAGAERELALARSPHFKPGVYSAIAGFTEPGESLEQAVHREVAEELGIRVHHLRYFGSQPWPFPNGLMVAFLADHLDGELRPDPAELEDARWFRLDALPDLPAPLSIARWMLDAAVAGKTDQPRMNTDSHG
ncbi:NAD(+) diphosphatase [Geothrix mesophila]|uniref:NAD(+) diphosphatase n=1 Tax=Geothrix mesophila TaxID=2922723 RepID=UPI001FABEFBE|nr:NAD(+) diphosphatase [Geothrix sp. SG198]